ncbi:MAG: DUF362 domain-containing protein [Erysipelotrichaceae bacterium]|nr:DUF362 domain-containing protein [Erysipelotrichaceae bacterium]
MEKAKVYFTRTITPEKVVEMFKILNKELPGKVAVKLHSGEAGNKNYMRPEFVRPMVEYVKGTVVECNTAYPGARNTTEKHWKLIHDHGWDAYFDFDLLDAEGPDLVLPVSRGKTLKENLIGKNFANYDSLLVLSHFKGHTMGGYGGALKQLSIGCASSAGKSLIHSGGTNPDQYTLWNNAITKDPFMICMADAAGSVVDYFKGNAAYINCMLNMSVDCDCDGNAAPPCMKDIGILSSLDPVALDRACLDLVIQSDDPGKEQFMERVNSRHGQVTVDVAAEEGYGTKEYELIEVA